MINYYDVTDKLLKKKSQNSVVVGANIFEPKMQKQILNHLFGDDWNNDLIISYMTMEELEGYTVYSYITTDIEENPSQNVVVADEKGNPIFKAIFIEKWSRNYETHFTETEYSIYDDDKNVENMINTRMWKTRGLEDFMVVETNIHNLNGHDHHYRLYMKESNEGIISFENHGEMYLIGQESYQQRLDVIKKNINNVEKKISSVFNDIIDEDNIIEYKKGKKEDR